eukprot:423651_1
MLPKHFLKQRELKNKPIANETEQVIMRYGLHRKWLNYIERMPSDSIDPKYYDTLRGAFRALELWQKGFATPKNSIYFVPPSVDILNWMSKKQMKKQRGWIIKSFIAFYLQTFFCPRVNGSTFHELNCGYLMLFHHKMIIDELAKVPLLKMTRKWTYNLNSRINGHMVLLDQNEHALNVTQSDILTAMSTLYGLTVIQFVQLGKYHITNGSVIESQCICSLVLGKYHSFIGEHKRATEVFCEISINSNRLYAKVIALRCLSDEAYKNGEYAISMKILRTCYFLCKGYLLPSFVNHKYPKQRRKIKKRIQTLRCSNCNVMNRKNKPHKACMGCMKSVYCSRKCQKIWWKKQHRFECERHWNHSDFSMYLLLKQYIFDRL